jgi:hypothetical protein
MTRYHHAWLLAALAAPAALAGLATPALAQGSGFNNSGITTPGVGSNVSIGTTATSPAATGNAGSAAAANDATTLGTTSAGATIGYGQNVVVVPGTYPRRGVTVIRDQSGGDAPGSTPTGALNGGVPTGALDGGVPGTARGVRTYVPGGNAPATGAGAAGAAR